MTNNPDIQTSTNKMVLSMPPSISYSFIVDVLQKFGCEIINEEKPMIQNNYYLKGHDSNGVLILNLIGQEISKEVDESVTSVSFFEEGDFFRIGLIGKETLLKKSNGLKYIHFLLQHPEKKLDSISIYHLGKNSGDIIINNYDDQLFIQGNLKDRVLDKKARASLRARMEELYTELKTNYFLSEEEKMEKEDQYEQLNSFLNKRAKLSHRPEEVRARINIQKNIKNALNKIREMSPEVSKYLNTITIKTGFSCYYQPLPADSVAWILHR